MAGDNYYLITALPVLGDLGGAVPMTGEQLLEHVREARAPRAMIEALFLGDDLLQREALLAGEIDQPTPVVLSPAQVRGDQPLPGFLSARPGPARRIGADELWEAYFRYAASVAAETRNDFGRQWVAHEVALRNALATRRARTLELEAGDYLVASDLASEDEDFASLLNDWSTASNPLAGLRILDRARWVWLDAHDRYFSFADDELAAYAARLMLLQRWRRLEAANQHEPDPTSTPAE